MASHETKVTMENEEKQVQLAQKVLRATFEQIKAQVQEDMVQLKSRLPGAESQAVETAKDLKHMRDRQQTLASSFIYGLACSCVAFWRFWGTACV